ncbi:ATP-binding protein [Dactylosporangium vinaceum]|uniref:ATP-binding protein n=1 Tax=Dactylosporangium vinaceum TaxID=53362 RepID=A0ABV5MEL5_9ACTN|nr:ATP-binding protein [Dactylosporangium vinaceum]UAB92361.1 ATP-binding protein [Dactylosporangium vinaceum]
MTPDELTCTHEPGFPVAVLRATGRLTFASVSLLRGAGQKALTDHPEVLLIDVAGLVAVDDITLTVFPMIARHGVDFGTDMMLVGATPALHAQLDRLGVARQVPVHTGPAEAVAAHARMPGPRRLELALAARPASTSAARELVDRACAQWRLPELADRAALIVTELVANAIEHAGTPMLVSVALRDRHLHLAVHDESRLPLERSGDAGDDEDEEPGRGLLIVEGMASAWGCLHTAGGKVVWATLRREPRR